MPVAQGQSRTAESFYVGIREGCMRACALLKQPPLKCDTFCVCQRAEIRSRVSDAEIVRWNQASAQPSIETAPFRGRIEEAVRVCKARHGVP
jgi:hypothetical protein